MGNELRVDGITVVCLGPGYAPSESAELLSSDGYRPRHPHPVEVATRAVAYLSTCSDPLRFAGCSETADFLEPSASLCNDVPPTDLGRATWASRQGRRLGLFGDPLPARLMERSGRSVNDSPSSKLNCRPTGVPRRPS